MPSNVRTGGDEMETKCAAVRRLARLALEPHPPSNFIEVGDKQIIWTQSPGTGLTLAIETLGRGARMLARWTDCEDGPQFDRGESVLTEAEADAMAEGLVVALARLQAVEQCVLSYYDWRLAESRVGEGVGPEDAGRALDETVAHFTGREWTEEQVRRSVRVYEGGMREHPRGAAVYKFSRWLASGTAELLSLDHSAFAEWKTYQLDPARLSADMPEHLRKRVVGLAEDEIVVLVRAGSGPKNGAPSAS
jgi:hypothetical protein